MDNNFSIEVSCFTKEREKRQHCMSLHLLDIWFEDKAEKVAEEYKLHSGSKSRNSSLI
jgi:hypothetical protein